MKAVGRWLASVSLLLMASCPLADLTNGDSPRDAAVDAAADDAGAEAPAPDAGGAQGPFHDVTDPAHWETFALGLSGFSGGAFDGRYLYFAPTGTTIVRYDTHGPFAVADSWSTFDASQLNAQGRGFRGAVFDGRHVYFVPNKAGTGANGLVVRVDTKAPSFTDPLAWETFDTAPLSVDDAGQSQTRGFFGGAFDGRYLYLVPWSNTPGSLDGVAVRYDTMASFAAASSWSYGKIPSAAAYGFEGAVFDGRFLYYIDSDCCGYLTRFDTLLMFTAPASWNGFAMSAVNSGPLGFATGIFDGRYLYLVPNGGKTPTGLISRFDTKASFALRGSFATFDVASLDSDLKGFFGGAFDGRYVYLAPYFNGAAPLGKVARYDTHAEFAVAAAWSSFDTARLVDAGAGGYSGALFDGRYVYFVPFAGSVVVRFDAREPAALPSGYSGSFY
jgi:hypothetical protein